MTHLLNEAPQLILSRDAIRAGRHSRLVAARAIGEITAVRRGVHVRTIELAAMTRAERCRARALAAGKQRKNPVFAGVAAAAILGLPLVGQLPEEVHLLSPGSSGRRRNGVVEIGRRGWEEVVDVDGLLVTDIVTTLMDACRQLSLRAGLALVDAAVWEDPISPAPLIQLEELRQTVQERLPFRGSRSVEAVLRRASSQAESTLESISRINIEELGFPAPVLQLAIPLPRPRRVARLDLAWPEYEAWGEADGAGKYLGAVLDPNDRRTPAQIVIDEKKREDAVRRATRWTCGRWDWAEANNLARLRSILLEIGLPVIRRPGLIT